MATYLNQQEFEALGVRSKLNYLYEALFEPGSERPEESVSLPVLLAATAAGVTTTLAAVNKVLSYSPEEIAGEPSLSVDNQSLKFKLHELQVGLAELERKLERKNAPNYGAYQR